MKTKRNIEILFENGLTFSTIKNLTPNQVKVLVEKFTKKDEVGEAVTISKVPQKPQEDIKATGSGAFAVKSPGAPQINMTLDGSADLKNVPVGTKVEALEAEELDEKFASKAQQKLFFVKCGNGKTKEQKKWCKLRDEFAKSTTTKDYKKMPEKLHPEKTVPVKKRKSIKEEEYERFLEKKIVSLVEKHIDPEMTKGDLIQTIMEKVNKSKNFMLKNPKKNTMFQTKGRMTKPIGNLYSISGEMKEDTKEKERTKERTKERETTKEPGKKDPFKPKHRPKPKAKFDELKEMYGTETVPVRPGTKEREKTKQPGKKDPFKPKHSPKPKAGRPQIPSWLSWNKLGVKLK